jgi:hypothetical protein
MVYSLDMVLYNPALFCSSFLTIRPVNIQSNEEFIPHL